MPKNSQSQFTWFLAILINNHWVSNLMYYCIILTVIIVDSRFFILFLVTLLMNNTMMIHTNKKWLDLWWLIDKERSPNRYGWIYNALCLSLYFFLRRSYDYMLLWLCLLSLLPPLRISYGYQFSVMRQLVLLSHMKANLTLCLYTQKMC